MTIQNLWDAVKTVLRGKFIAMQACLRKQISQISNPNLKELEKEQTKPKVSRRKEIIKIRAEIKWNRDQKKEKEKTNEIKNWFFEKINKIYKPLARLMKKKTGPKSIKSEVKWLPWWRSGWESACQCRGHGFEPWSGKIPHAGERLGPWATIAEPARLEPVLRNKRGRDGEGPVHCDEEWSPLATTRESPRTETKTQHSHK